ncbi:MAG: aminoacyl-tRNA hydrolase [Rhodomicrobium sp.]
MKLIVGLGNPGEKYAGNRHNIGFMAVDELARGYAFGPWKKRFQGLVAEGQIGIEKCILLKPMTYMNESGRSAGEAMRFYKLSAGDVIAVHDELDLKPGTVRVKTGGGNAGHNGLKSLSAHLGNEYVRVRLGIGHPGDKALVANYVLQDFAKADRQWLEPFLEAIARGMSRLVEGGEAAFLSEAARGRAQSAVAAKTNGAAAPATSKIAAPAPKIEAVSDAERKAAAMAAAVSHPLRTEPSGPIPVFAAREASGGGAVSRAVMLPEPERPAPAAAEPAPKIERAPLPAWQEAKVQEVQPAPAPVIQPASQPAATVTRQAAPSAPAPMKQAAPAQKKKGGFFSRLFGSRTRGASGH